MVVLAGQCQVKTTSSVPGQSPIVRFPCSGCEHAIGLAAVADDPRVARVNRRRGNVYSRVATACTCCLHKINKTRLAASDCVSSIRFYNKCQVVAVGTRRGLGVSRHREVPFAQEYSRREDHHIHGMVPLHTKAGAVQLFHR